MQRKGDYFREWGEVASSGKGGSEGFGGLKFSVSYIYICLNVPISGLRGSFLTPMFLP
jgi:hypothetical protein